MQCLLEHLRYLIYQFSAVLHKEREFSSRVSKQIGGSHYYSRRMSLHSKPRESHVTPQTAALRAPAGVALGRVRPPLAHNITRVPAFGLSVEAFYFGTYQSPQKLHTVGIKLACYMYQFFGGLGRGLLWRHNNATGCARRRMLKDLQYDWIRKGGLNVLLRGRGEVSLIGCLGVTHPIEAPFSCLWA